MQYHWRTEGNSNANRRADCVGSVGVGTSYPRDNWRGRVDRNRAAVVEAAGFAGVWKGDVHRFGRVPDFVF